MKHKMFVVFDSKANAYMQPWFLTTEGMAIRAFTDCINTKDHNFARHPEDYTLFKIGEFDDQKADIQWQAPKSIGNGIEYLKPQTDVTEHTINTYERRLIDIVHDQSECDDTMLVRDLMRKLNGEGLSQ